jgi:hypothetical protein
MTDFSPCDINDEGPFTLTRPIHTHYYTPRDNNDWRNKQIWFNIDEEQPFCVLPFPRESRLVVFSSRCFLLLYNRKRLHIQASKTTYIRLYGTGPPILSIFSSFRDEVHNMQHCSTTAPPTNGKLLTSTHYTSRLSNCWHFFTLSRSMSKKLTWEIQQCSDHIC